jgi:hypothetical protein
VVANVLGVKCKSVEVDRRAGYIGDSAVYPRLTGAWTPILDKPYSHEEQILIMCGGRVESERERVFLPFMLGQSDEGYAIASALSLAHGDTRAASKTLVSSYTKAKRILDAHQDDVAAVAAALVEADLDASDVKRILGPLPRARRRRTIAREPLRLDSASAVPCIAAMMAGHPFALAWTPVPATLLWLDMDGTLRADYR